MLTARSWPVLTVSATGSLLISAPLTRTPTDARPNRTARSPNVLDSRIRTEPPPARDRTIMRMVWLVKEGTVVSAAEECGAAAQASTHVDAAEAVGPGARRPAATSAAADPNSQQVRRAGPSTRRFAIVDMYQRDGNVVQQYIG